MANLKAFWEHPGNGRFATLRFIYRSRWGIADMDGNGLINRSDEFGRGFLQVNLSAGTTIARGLRMTAGIDNLLNHRDPATLPGLPGINPYLSLSIRPSEKRENGTKTQIP
jgi:outer membrane receptor for ferrienterochelin and colicins